MLDAAELRAIVNRLPDGVIALDRNLDVVFANPAAAVFFKPQPIRVGKPLPPAALDPDLTSFARELFGRTPRTTTRQVDRNGRAYVIHGIPPHQRRFATLVFTEVSGRSRRERARTEFVANAAHELLTPLTGIASAAHVLESGAKEVPEMRDRFLDHIARECSRLIRVARGLLVLARAQSAEEPPRPEFVELRPLLDDVLDARPHGIDVNLECPDELAVFVDRDLVEIALSNLVANAIRHSAEGALSIAVDRTPSRRVRILIAEAGRAIDDGDLARLQRRFATGGGRDGGGFGLGMSIASQAIETIGGTLEYVAENGSTSVRVELPPARR